MKKKHIGSLVMVGVALVFSVETSTLSKALAEEITLQVLNPRGELPSKEAKTLSLSPRVSDLAGKRIALIANWKAGAELFLTKVEELLKQKYPTAKIVRFKTDQNFKNFPDIAKQCDLFIHSTGD